MHGLMILRWIAREKLLDFLPSLTFHQPHLPVETREPCLNLFVEAPEAVKLNSNGPTSQPTKTERFVRPMIAPKLATIASSLLMESVELPRSQYQRADGSLAEKQGYPLVL